VPPGLPLVFSGLRVALRPIRGSAGLYDREMFTSIRGSTDWPTSFTTFTMFTTVTQCYSDSLFVT